MEDANAKLAFSCQFPDVAFGRFVIDLTTFKEAQERLKAQQCLQQNESEVQLQQSNSNEAICDNLLCRRNFESIINENRKLKERVETLEVNFERLSNYVQQEFQKMIPEEQRFTSAKNGDKWLQNKWHVPSRSLLSAANSDCSNSVVQLVDRVFGQATLRKYRSAKLLPNENNFPLKSAFEELLCMFY